MRVKQSVTVRSNVTRRPDTHRQQGFTLLELMTVVAIVGILSAMAIPTFSDYVFKSRATEATEFLGVIRLREEAYRAEFGAYCPTLPAGSSPTLVASLDQYTNLIPNPTTTQAKSTVWTGSDEWRQLGAAPSGYVRFGYGVVAGTPANIPAGLGFEGRPDYWWVARAVGDLDADGSYVMFETYSAGKGVFIGTFPSGTPIAKGWE